MSDEIPLVYVLNRTNTAKGPTMTSLENYVVPRERRFTGGMPLVVDRGFNFWLDREGNIATVSEWCHEQWKEEVFPDALPANRRMGQVQ